jgi:hypothetical protein
MFRIASGMVATKPDHQREHEGNRKNRRAGNAGLVRRTCGGLICVLSIFARGAAGESIARHSLRPCVEKICQNVQTGGLAEPPVAGTEPVAPEGHSLQ